MRAAQFTARSANSRGLARNSRRLAVNSFVLCLPHRGRRGDRLRWKGQVQGPLAVVGVPRRELASVGGSRGRGTQRENCQSIAPSVATRHLPRMGGKVTKVFLARNSRRLRQFSRSPHWRLRHIIARSAHHCRRHIIDEVTSLPQAQPISRRRRIASAGRITSTIFCVISCKLARKAINRKTPVFSVNTGIFLVLSAVLKFRRAARSPAFPPSF